MQLVCCDQILQKPRDHKLIWDDVVYTRRAVDFVHSSEFVSIRIFVLTFMLFWPENFASVSVGTNCQPCVNHRPYFRRVTEVWKCWFTSRFQDSFLQHFMSFYKSFPSSSSSWGPGSWSHGACTLPQNRLRPRSCGDHRHPRPDPLQETLHLRSPQTQAHPGRTPRNPLHRQTVSDPFRLPAVCLSGSHESLR